MIRILRVVIANILFVLSELTFLQFLIPLNSSYNLKWIKESSERDVILFTIIYTAFVYRIFGVNGAIIMFIAVIFIPLLYYILSNETVSCQKMDKIALTALIPAGILYTLYNFLWDKLLTNSSKFIEILNKLSNIKSSVTESELKRIIVSQLSEIEKMSNGSILEGAKNSIELTIVFLSMDSRLVFFKLFLILFFIVIFIALVDEKEKFREWKVGYWMVIPYIFSEIYINLYYPKVVKNLFVENGLIVAENIKYIIMIIFIIWGIKELNMLIKTKKSIKIVRVVLSIALLLVMPKFIFIFGAIKSFFIKKIN